MNIVSPALPHLSLQPAAQQLSRETHLPTSLPEQLLVEKGKGASQWDYICDWHDVAGSGGWEWTVVAPVVGIEYEAPMSSSDCCIRTFK